VRRPARGRFPQVRGALRSGWGAMVERRPARGFSFGGMMVVQWTGGLPLWSLAPVSRALFQSSGFTENHVVHFIHTCFSPVSRLIRGGAQEVWQRMACSTTLGLGVRGWESGVGERQDTGRRRPRPSLESLIAMHHVDPHPVRSAHGLLPEGEDPAIFRTWRKRVRADRQPRSRPPGCKRSGSSALRSTLGPKNTWLSPRFVLS